MTGGVYTYRATAECSACGRVVDVGPFEMIRNAVAENLPGWLVPSSLDGWTIRDGVGRPITLCNLCMTRPLQAVLADVKERAIKE